MAVGERVGEELKNISSYGLGKWCIAQFRTSVPKEEFENECLTDWMFIQNFRRVNCILIFLQKKNSGGIIQPKFCRWHTNQSITGWTGDDNSKVDICDWDRHGVLRCVPI